MLLLFYTDRQRYKAPKTISHRLNPHPESTLMVRADTVTKYTVIYTVRKGRSHAISGFPIFPSHLPQLGRLQSDSGSISACPLMDSWREQPGLCTQGWSADVLVCHLCVDVGRRLHGSVCEWDAKHTHHKGKLCISSSGSAGEGECFPHRRNGHQLGLPGRRMHCGGRVTPATAIVHYLSEQWFI